MKNEDVTDRVLAVQKALNLSNADFAKALNIQRPNISHLRAKRNKASLDTVQRLLKAFPEVNLDWLVVGKGEMFKDNKEHLFEDKDDENNKESKKTDDLQKNKQNNDADTNNIHSDGTNVNSNQVTDNQQQSTSHLAGSKQNVQNSVFQNVNPQTNQQSDPFGTVSDILDHQNRMNSSKRIVRIVIFYSDKTFSDFRPE